MLVHQNPPFVAFMDAFNAEFEADNPDIKVEMAVVNANELMTSTQTRLMANDVDVFDIFAYSNAAEAYMEGTDSPGWQSLIDAGLIMDLTDQPFVANYDPASSPMPALTTAACTRSIWAASFSAASTTTRTCSRRTASRCRRRGPSSWPPARR